MASVSNIRNAANMIGTPPFYLAQKHPKKVGSRTGPCYFDPPNENKKGHDTPLETNSLTLPTLSSKRKLSNLPNYHQERSLSVSFQECQIKVESSSALSAGGSSIEKNLGRLGTLSASE